MRRFVIIGAGPGGIAAGHRLKEAGFDDVTIVDRADGVGGTWWRNRYPGLSCDVPSHLYSFSFAPKADWTRPYAGQAEILAYMERCVDELDLRRHLRLGTEVRAARWDEAAEEWRVELGTGEVLHADAVISSQGMFGDLKWPDIPGRDDFAGEAFHTGAWPSGRSFAGERVAVVGSAASAVQLVPPVAEEAAQLHVFQRSPNWILPKDDTPYTEEQLERFRTDPSAVAELRAALQEQVGAGFSYLNEAACQAAEDACRQNLLNVEDPELRARMTPTVPWGCLRPLLSNAYYPTFNRDHVELVTDPIERITPTGIVTADGVEREVDVIVYATGYEVTRYASRIEVVGRSGRRLADEWAEGASAYLGVTTTGFPNFFMLYGPNTNQGSIIFMIECAVAHVLRHVELAKAEGHRWVDVRPEVLASFNEQLQRDLDAVRVWDAGCSNYYRGPSGRIVTQWPHSMYRYRELTAEVDLDEFEVHP
jgi:cation diffusion facilitator CzcD-associated flavoprotein CzcO